jgi:prepilin-type N-terminal cleavage/methylation domain-containing protein
MNTKKAKKSQRGFTLIELLIVIGLLGALTALILPKLSASRTEAIVDVCHYNKAGTARALMQYANVFGRYPSDLHNGLQGTDASALAMEGHASPQTARMVTNINTTRHALTADQAVSLAASGITSISSGTGFNSTPVAADVNVAVAASADGSNPWAGGGKPEITFDGVLVSDWAAGTGGAGWNQGKAGPVVVLWIAPTVNWSAGSGDNNDWTKGSVELGVSLEGQCPVPTKSTTGGDPSFKYYMAYFKVFSDGSPARMIGLTCAGGGTLNP